VCVRVCGWLQNAMVSTVDETAANVSAALKRTGLWAETLLVWSTDNGSPVQVAGSNAPLRGGKGSNWEGGCRVPAFVTVTLTSPCKVCYIQSVCILQGRGGSLYIIQGGFLPVGQRGKSYTAGLAHIIDWYKTFALLAGADPLGDQDTAPAPLESLDLWPWLSGQTADSPRNEIIYDHRMNTTDKRWNTSGLPGYASGALRVGDWKLLVGAQKQASWFGHFTPNASACSKPPSDAPTILLSTAAAVSVGANCSYDALPGNSYLFGLVPGAPLSFKTLAAAEAWCCLHATCNGVTQSVVHNQTFTARAGTKACPSLYNEVSVRKAGVTPDTTKSCASAKKESCPDISQVACEDQPCLFNVGPTGVGDKTEHVDLASSQPAVLAELLARWEEISAHEYHPPPNPDPLEVEYCAGIEANRGFVAPWLH
jgi:hypothetical protein